MVNTVRSAFALIPLTFLALAPLTSFAQTSPFNLPSQPLAEAVEPEEAVGVPEEPDRRRQQDGGHRDQQAGPQFGILLNQDRHLVESGKDAFKKGDFSLVGGAQLNIANIVVGGRYVIGLTDIKDLPEGNKWKNQGFQVYAGFRFF